MICPAPSPAIVPYSQTAHRCTPQAVSHPQSAQCCRRIPITLLTGQLNGECCSMQRKVNTWQFQQENTTIQVHRVTMNGTPIPHVTSLIKHLGVNFNNTLSWHQRVDNVYTSCARRIGMIRWLQRKLPPPPPPLFWNEYIWEQYCQNWN